MKQLLTFCTLLAGSAAHAHEGHGLGGAHWHATDTVGFIVGTVAVAALLWWHRRK